MNAVTDNTPNDADWCPTYAQIFEAIMRLDPSHVDYSDHILAVLLAAAQLKDRIRFEEVVNQLARRTKVGKRELRRRLDDRLREAGVDGFDDLFDPAPTVLSGRSDGPRESTPQEIAEKVAEINMEYFVVATGGKTLVGRFNERGAVETMPPKDFEALKASDHLFRTDSYGYVKPVGSGKMWVGHSDRRTYPGGFGFDPKGPRDLPGGKVNLWQGYGIQPKAGKWPLLQAHATDILAGGSRESADYILRWIAWKFQNPSQLPEVALVFKSLEGTGKSIFAGVLAKIFGAHARVLTSPGHLTNHFNGHMRGACLAVAEEAFFAGDRAGAGVLFNLITAPRQLIEGKGRDAVEEDNHCGLIMLTNHARAVPAGKNARRFAVFNTSDRYAKNHAPEAERTAYFRALAAEIENGGAAAMLHDLLALDLGGWHPRDDVPATDALQEQKAQSLEPLDRWWEHVLAEGRLPAARDAEEAPTTWHTARPRVFMASWATANAQAQLKDRFNELSADSIGRYLRAAVKFPSVRQPTGVRGYSAPPLKEARAAWERRFGEWTWDDPDADWIDPYDGQPGVGAFLLQP